MKLTSEVLDQLIGQRGLPARKKKPPPLRPANAAERRMVERGARSGFLATRYGGAPIARLYPAGECPYPDEGRPRALWLAGFRMGARRGSQARAAVQRSYLEGLERLDAGAPRSWGS